MQSTSCQKFFCCCCFMLELKTLLNVCIHYSMLHLFPQCRWIARGTWRSRWRWSEALVVCQHLQNVTLKKLKKNSHTQKLYKKKSSFLHFSFSDSFALVPFSWTSVWGVAAVDCIVFFSLAVAGCGPALLNTLPLLLNGCLHPTPCSVLFSHHTFTPHIIIFITDVEKGGCSCECFRFASTFKPVVHVRAG